MFRIGRGLRKAGVLRLQLFFDFTLVLTWFTNCFYDNLLILGLIFLKTELYVRLRFAGSCF